MDLRKILLPLGLVTMLLIVAGIFMTPHNKNATEEEMLKTAFNLIRKGDWENYKPYVITLMDINQAENDAAEQAGGGPRQGFIAKSMSYGNKVMKPEELAAHKQLFDLAHTGGEGMIDFNSAKFVGVGSVISEQMAGQDYGTGVPSVTYSIMVKQDGDEVDTKDLFPRFTLVPWKKRFLVLALTGPEVVKRAESADE